jgi:hypothetical protein
MAIYKNGANGTFSGKVGAIVGATWKGMPYMRALPSKRTSPLSETESSNRNKFSKAHHWLKPVLPFVRVGFKGYSATIEGFLAAKSYLLKNAFEHSGNGLVINPALVKVSHGELPLPGNITASQVHPEKVQFTWDTTAINKQNCFDQVMLLAYDTDNAIAYYHVPGQPRMNGTDELTIGPALFTRTLHLYVAFIAADRSRQSNSVYLGAMGI